MTIYIPEELIERQLAVTTLASDDNVHGERLQEALDRGEDELFAWGVGPELKRGAVVAMYVPLMKKRCLLKDEQQKIRHLYSVATNTRQAPWGKWNRAVFLYRRITLSSPLLLSELKALEQLGLARTAFRNAGRSHKALRLCARRAFWRLAYQKNIELDKQVKDRLLRVRSDSPDEVAISYASEDLEIAQALHASLRCKDNRLTSFYATSTQIVGPTDQLTNLLTNVFENARIRVALLSKYYLIKKWPLHELETMLKDPERVLIVSVDGTSLLDARERLAFLSNKPQSWFRRIKSIDFKEYGPEGVALRVLNKSKTIWTSGCI